MNEVYCRAGVCERPPAAFGGSPICKGFPCPTSFAGPGALKTTEEKAEVPSLDKEGWLRPLRKCREASLAGADGVVGSSHRLNVMSLAKGDGREAAGGRSHTPSGSSNS